MNLRKTTRKSSRRLQRDSVSDQENASSDSSESDESVVQRPPKRSKRSVAQSGDISYSKNQDVASQPAKRSPRKRARFRDEELASQTSSAKAFLESSTGSVEESTDDVTVANSSSVATNGPVAWENVGVMKEDDDRVAEEVSKRYEMARTLCADSMSAGKSLLEHLLDQSDKYTGFMLARSLASGLPQAAKSEEKSRRRQQRIGDMEEELLMKEADEELTGHQHGFWTRLSRQPAIITGGTLKPYQLEGLNWLIHLYESGLNGILADEMGLGKTFQSISLMAYLKESRDICGPHLILAPKSTLGNWLNEIQRFCPSLRAYRFHGTKEERQKAKDRGLLNANNEHYDIFITSYELCMKEQAVFRKFHFRYIIVDEAHRIKNEASKLSKVIRTFNTQFRLLLTGTPLQNNLRELWSLLNFLFPEMFASSEEFDRIFDLTGSYNDSSRSLSSEERTARNEAIVGRLHKILKPFLLRRVKSEVMVELPPKKELLLYVPLSKMQRALYRVLLAKNVDFLLDTGGRVRLLNLAMQLRKACNHPYLFEGYEDKSLDPFGEHLITSCGKLILLDRLLRRLISTGHRILIFTQMTRMLDILEDYCRMREFSYCRLDGSTIGEERERQIDEFNAPASPQSVFLLSTRAGGLGINLATADTVIIYDSDFNPQVDLQAMDRAHRIGQRKPVNVYRLIHENTIEEKIIERAMLKLRLDTAVIQQGRLSDKHSQQLSKTDLMRLIQYGADQIFKSATTDITELTDEDIDAILSRGEQRTLELSGKLERHMQHKTKNLLDFDFSSAANLYEFEGVDYNADRHAWADLAVSVFEEERNAKRKVRIVQEQMEELQRQQLLASSGSAGPSRNKSLKLPRMEEWQFFNRARIFELHNLELEHISMVASGIIKDEEFSGKEEKQALLARGFGDWSKKDFFNFVKACESVGIGNIDSIARDIGKSVEDTSRYLKTFLEQYQELNEGEKWFKRVKAGDDVNVKRKKIEDLLMRKLGPSSDTWRQLALKLSKSKTQFTDEEDRWLLNATLAVGYGNWDSLQMAVSSDPLWTFNWFMRSRSPQDLARRVEFLVRQLQKGESEETATRSKAKGDTPRRDSRLYCPEIIYKSTIVPANEGHAASKRAARKLPATPRKRKKAGEAAPTCDDAADIMSPLNSAEMPGVYTQPAISAEILTEEPLLVDVGPLLAS